MDTNVRLLLAILATFKIAMILVHEKWGEGVREWAKVWMQDKDGIPLTRLGRILSCFWCTSFLVAIPLAIWALGWNTHAIIGGCAIGGAVVLLYHWSGMHRLFR